MDFLGFEFTPAAVLALLVTAWAAGVAVGVVVSVLSSVQRR